MERFAPAPVVAPNGATSVETLASGEVSASGVSWAAVLGGAVVAAALSLILLALGTGLGLSSVSPWSNAGASAATVGVGAIIWLIAAQIMAFALGGYLAGRLRIKWATVHTDEVFFRDTAHGLLVWAVAAVVTAGLLGAAATTMAGNAARSNASAGPARGEAVGAEALDPTVDAVDGVFRSDRATGDRADPAMRAEVGRIFTSSIRHRELAGADKTYVGSLVASRTGLSQSDAEQRVTQVFADLQQTIDAARKSAATLSLWIFVALLTGAFCASYAATIGGRQRDHVQHV
jgi:hypothetical protein